MKIAVVGGVAFVLGVAAGTFTAPAPALPEELPVDSATVTEAANPTNPPVPPAGEPTTTPSADDSTATPGAGPPSAIAAALEGLTPEQAAPVLARLPEPDVLRLLQAVPVERAAALLDQLPVELSARLSRQLLMARSTP
jgi:hypothetical protein